MAPLQLGRLHKSIVKTIDSRLPGGYLQVDDMPPVSMSTDPHQRRMVGVSRDHIPAENGLRCWRNAGRPGVDVKQI